MTTELQTLQEFIRSETGYAGALDPDLDLMNAKILDSFNIVVLASFIQQRFEIELEPEDVVRANLCKLSSILLLIERKKSSVRH
jgi:acyl carrier protein